MFIALILVVATFIGVKNTTFVILLIMSILFLGSTFYQYKVKNETRELVKKSYKEDESVEKYMHFYARVYLRGQLIIGVILFVGAIIAFSSYPQGLGNFFISKNLIGLFTIFIGISLYLASDKIIEKSPDMFKRLIMIRGFKVSCWVIVLMGMVFIVLKI